jgi:DNA-directed RNA polymerase subunit M/transcription elongation factor TFIIS
MGLSIQPQMYQILYSMANIRQQARAGLTNRTIVRYTRAMGIGEERCSEYPGFECPICGHRRYYRILVQREQQPAYRTSFYGCFGCSAMFTDPYRFTQTGKAKGGNFGSSTYGPAAKGRYVR